MNIAVIGSRSFNNYELVEYVLNQYQIGTIISGGARGTDTLAEMYADKHNIKKDIKKNDYPKYGKAGYQRRNEEIVRACDFILAFWDRKSNGTRNALKYAESIGKTYFIIDV